MWLLKLGHEINHMIVDFDSFLKEITIFPDQNFCDEIPNGLGFDMVAKGLNIVFIRFENEIKELHKEKGTLAGFLLKSVDKTLQL